MYQPEQLGRPTLVAACSFQRLPNQRLIKLFQVDSQAELIWSRRYSHVQVLGQMHHIDWPNPGRLGCPVSGAE
jgi:hypothetical protein